MPNLICPHCSNSIFVNDSQSGSIAVCPVCRKEFTVPNFSVSAPPAEYYTNSAEYVGPSSSGLAITGFVLSFFCALAGLICSIIALSNMKRDNNPDGRGFAVAGLVISILCMVLGVLVSIIQAVAVASL